MIDMRPPTCPTPQPRRPDAESEAGAEPDVEMAMPKPMKRRRAALCRPDRWRVCVGTQTRTRPGGGVDCTQAGRWDRSGRVHIDPRLSAGCLVDASRWGPYSTPASAAATYPANVTCARLPMGWYVRSTHPQCQEHLAHSRPPACLFVRVVISKTEGRFGRSRGGSPGHCLILSGLTTTAGSQERPQPHTHTHPHTQCLTISGSLDHYSQPIPLQQAHTSTHEGVVHAGMV